MVIRSTPLQSIATARSRTHHGHPRLTGRNHFYHQRHSIPTSIPFPYFLYFPHFLFNAHNSRLLFSHTTNQPTYLGCDPAHALLSISMAHVNSGGVGRGGDGWGVCRDVTRNTSTDVDRQRGVDPLQPAMVDSHLLRGDAANHT